MHQTHAEAFHSAVAQTPDATMAELRATLGLDVALSTVWRALDALSLTFTKK